jgi:hypothetical protein
MTKQQYLKMPIVKEFTEWLSLTLSNPYTHSYVINSNGPANNAWIAYNNSQDWNCSSIFNAYEKYHWGKKYCDFNSNSAILNTLEKIGKFGLERNNNDIISMYCLNVFEWGGVKGNDKYINNYGSNHGFVDILNEISSGINKLNPTVFNDDETFPNIKLNAGFTKVYSLLIKDFIIYDSRVAKALCKLISQFLALKNQLGNNNVDPLLALKIPRGRRDEGGNLIFDNRFAFQLFNDNNNYHQISNIRASWILKEVLRVSPKSQFNQLPNDQNLRALEAALFMIGYQIN